MLSNRNLARRPWQIRVARAFAVTAMSFAISSAVVPHAAAQLVTGVVIDSARGAPVVGASVSQVRGEEVLARVGTDANGRFQLRLEGDPPFELLFDRFGYEPSRTRFESRAAVDELEVRLLARPVLLSELSVGAARDPVDFWWHQVYRFTDDGMFVRGDPMGGCFFFALDSVVLRDPRLFLPERMDYSPARLFSRGPPPGRGYRSNDEIPDERLRRDAWPCAAMILLHDADYSGFSPVAGLGPRVLMPERETPGPDAPRYDLIASVEVELPAASTTPGLEWPAAVANDGLLAVASGAAPVVTLVDASAVDPDAVRVNSLDLGLAPASLREITHIGWLADTLWAADAVRRRVVLAPREGAPMVRAPPTPTRREPVEGASTDLYDPALLVSTPLPTGAWFAVQAEAAALFPPRMEDEPARRRLVTLTPEGRLNRVLAILRPGPWRFDLDTPGTPVEPFRDHPLYALAPDGDHVTVVERAFEVAVWRDIYTVTRIGLTGDTIFHVERRAPLIPITDDAFEETAEEISSHPIVAGALARTGISDALVESLLYRPRYHPPISDVVVGQDGSTWLRWPDERENTVRWDVLDQRGRPVRVISADRRLRIIAADGETVWGLVRDQRSGDRVARYTLRARG